MILGVDNDLPLHIFCFTFNVIINVMEIKYIVGIDEVGRGPIAGPVCVASFRLPINNYQLLIEKTKKELKIPLRDSKKLTKKQREKWFEFLKAEKEKGNCDFAVSFVSSENIDKFGIVKCIQKALNESLVKITSQEMLFARSSDFLAENFFFEDGSSARPSQKASPVSFKVLLDGGLHAPKEFIYQETIIRGDELHPVISCASIVAKVSRDKVMENFAKKYPEYGFESHVGYGTKAHYEAIKKHGQTPIHRKTFIH